jgi:hypothetical protein
MYPPVNQEGHMRALRAVSAVVVSVCAIATPGALGQAGSAQLPALTTGATHETQTLNIYGLTKDTSVCPVSDDPSYGVTSDNPIQVGGGAAYASSRSQRYLRALRGPHGEGLHFKRLGSFEQSERVILDVYLVEYAETAQHLYLNAYQWAAPKAPLGWICGAAIGLDRPGPDPLETQRQLVTLASRLDETNTRPISLDADGSGAHGVVFDHTRLIGRAFVRAAAAGRPLDPENLPSAIRRQQFIVIAYPVACAGDALTAPEAVKVTDANGGAPRLIKELRGAEIQAFLPGFDAPATSLAVVHQGHLALPGRIEINYGATCSPVTLPMAGTAGRITHRVAGHVPAGVVVPPGSAQVRVQVYFDFDGAPQFPTYAGGPSALADAAVAAVTEFHAEPPRLNGAPLLQASTIAVAFEH